MLEIIRSVFWKLANGSSLRARLARATSWMVIGSGFGQGFAMLGQIGTARVLGTAAFGEFGAVRGTTMTIAVLAGGGLGLVTTRHVSALRAQDPQRAGRLIRLLLTLAWSMTAIATVACVLLARPIAAHVMEAEQLAGPLAISALALCFSTVSGVQIGVIAGCEAFRPVAILLILEGLSASALMIGGAMLRGVTGAVAGYVVGTIIAFALRQVQMTRECRKNGIPISSLDWPATRAEFPFLLSAVLPTMLLILGAQPSEWLVRMLLVRGPNGMSELGLFTAAYSWAQIVQFIPSQIAGPTLTILSGLVGAGEWDRFRRILLESIGVIVAVAAAIAVPLAFGSRWIMGFYGPAFRNGAPAFTVIVLAYVAGSVWTVLRLAFLSAGRPWLQFIFTISWGIALPAILLLQSPRSATSLSISYAISFVAVVLAQLLVMRVLFQRPRVEEAV